jgi:cytochrome c biogenesis protein
LLEVFLGEDKEKKDIFESIWKLFASVKLAIFLLIILALSSIIGTIVEQQAEPAKNITLLAKFFGDSAAPTVYNIFAKLGFMDMYGSWWFVSFLIFFCINLIVCSLERLPKTWRFINTPQRPLSDNAIKSLPLKKEVALKTSFEVAKDEVANVLHRARYKCLEATEGDSVQYYSQKGGYARLGAYVVHISIILIFIGAIIGARFGFKGYLNLPEGSYSDIAFKSPTEEIPLGFQIRCNWYKTEYYGDSTTPREFQSELVIMENGKDVLTKVIEVNSPLTYKGITFFQSSYGTLTGVLEEYVASQDPENGRTTTLQPTFSKFPNSVGRFIVRVTSENGQSNTLWLRRGEVFEIPGTGIGGTVVGFSPTLDRDRNTGALGTNSYYKDKMVMPAVAIEVSTPGNKNFIGWFVRNTPTWILPNEKHEIEFIDFRGIQYTGLQVAKDPGVWLIYLACITMGIALYVAFFISHKKIWVKVANEKKSVKIAVGGSVNRNRLNFEKEIERIMSHITKAIEGRSKK